MLTEGWDCNAVTHIIGLYDLSCHSCCVSKLLAAVCAELSYKR